MALVVGSMIGGDIINLPRDMSARASPGAGACALKLALRGKSYERNAAGRNKDIVVGLIATVYALWLLYAAGPSFVLMTALLFAPGIAVYAVARRNARQPLFSGIELPIALVAVAAAVLTVWLIYTGTITPL